MPQFVVDTSVIASAFTSNRQRDKALLLIKLASSFKIDLYAPPLLRYEFISVMVSSGFTRERANLNIGRFDTLTDMKSINLIYSRGYTQDAIDITFNSVSGMLGYIGAYDACFHALALNMKTPYLTADKKHYNKTSSSIGYVTLFDELDLSKL